MTVYFDNAATTFPKPSIISKAVSEAVLIYGGNPGRSGHKISMNIAGKVFETRELLADMFDSELENVIFTSNCTHSLNIAIQGIAEPGDNIIISSLEHNSVARPVYALQDRNVSFSVAKVCPDNEKTLENFKNLIRPNTKAIVCTIASNVTGQILPYKEIGELCKKTGICFIADGAQACGIIDVKLSDGINILCSAGHKGLYGTTGTGILITDGKYSIKSLMQGGTGTTSDSLEQTAILPEKLECGTLNTVGIIALGAGIKYINQTGIDNIFKHENELCNMFIDGLKDINNIKVYRNNISDYVPIVSFSHSTKCSEIFNSELDNEGFALRAGLHCSALAHETLGTTDIGTIRFSPSIFNTEKETLSLNSVIKKIS